MRYVVLASAMREGEDRLPSGARSRRRMLVAVEWSAPRKMSVDVSPTIIACARPHLELVARAWSCHADVDDEVVVFAPAMATVACACVLTAVARCVVAAVVVVEIHVFFVERGNHLVDGDVGHLDRLRVRDNINRHGFPGGDGMIGSASLSGAEGVGSGWTACRRNCARCRRAIEMTRELVPAEPDPARKQRQHEGRRVERVGRVERLFASINEALQMSDTSSHK